MSQTRNSNPEVIEEINDHEENSIQTSRIDGIVNNKRHHIEHDFVTDVSKKCDANAYNTTMNLRRRHTTKAPIASKQSTHVGARSKKANTIKDESIRRSIENFESKMRKSKFKKIVFNGTFPIDDPYSSRFERHNEDDEDNEPDEFE